MLEDVVVYEAAVPTRHRDSEEFEQLDDFYVCWPDLLLEQKQDCFVDFVNYLIDVAFMQVSVRR